MTVSSTTSRWEYNGDGGTVAFPYNNRIFAAADLKVYVDGAPKVLDTHYTVSGVDNPAGGNVTFGAAPAVGTKNVIIEREVPATQTAAYPANDPFPSAAHEKALDKLTVLVQQLQALAARKLGLAKSSTYAGTLDLPAPVGGRSLKWAADGLALVNSDNDPDSQVAAATAQAQAAATAAAAAAADRAAVADDRLTVANDTATARGYRDQAQGYRDQALAAATSLNLPVIGPADKGKALIVSPTGTLTLGASSSAGADLYLVNNGF